MSESGSFISHELRSQVIYQNLSGRNLTAEDKIGLIDRYNNELNTNPNLSVEQFAKRYGLRGNTVRNWIRRRGQGGAIHSNAGSSFVIDEAEQVLVVQEVKQYRLEHHSAPNRAEVANILQRHANATSDRLQRPRAQLSARLVTSYIQKLELRKRVPQVITSARDKACSDFRMIYSTMVMADSLAKDLPSDLLWNWDATTFIIDTPGKDQPVYIAKDDDLLIPPSIVTEDPFPFAIKWLHMANASGSTAPMILILGVDSIPQDKDQLYSLHGLNYTGDPTAKGWLVFCHSRAGTDTLYRWFLEEHLIKLINHVRDNSAMTDDFNMPLDAFVTCDGEKIVLDEVFNEEILNQLRDNNIHIGKLSASCSAIQQPLDRSPIFKAAKKRLKTIVATNIVWQNSTLVHNIKDVLGDVETLFDFTFPAEVMERIVFGCLAVRQALNETVTMKATQEGFEDTGWHPLSLNVMMDLCYNPISPEMRRNMIEHIAEDGERFIEQGYLTEEQYEDSHIPTLDDPDALPRDESTISHNRAVLLTHPNINMRRNSKISNDVEVQNIVNSHEFSKLEKLKVLKAVKYLENQENIAKRDEKRKEDRRNKTAEEKAEEKAARAEKTKMAKEKKQKRLEEEQRIIESAKKRRLG